METNINSVNEMLMHSHQILAHIRCTSFLLKKRGVSRGFPLDFYWISTGFLPRGVSFHLLAAVIRKLSTAVTQQSDANFRQSEPRQKGFMLQNHSLKIYFLVYEVTAKLGWDSSKVTPEKKARPLFFFGFLEGVLY